MWGEPVRIGFGYIQLLEWEVFKCLAMLLHLLYFSESEVWLEFISEVFTKSIGHVFLGGSKDTIGIKDWTNFGRFALCLFLHMCIEIPVFLG